MYNDEQQETTHFCYPEDEHAGKQFIGSISKTSAISIITDLSEVTSDFILRGNLCFKQYTERRYTAYAVTFYACFGGVSMTT